MRKATPVSTAGLYQMGVHGRRMLGVNRFPIFQYSQCRPVCFLIEVFLPREALYFQNEVVVARMGVDRRRRVRNEEFHYRARESKWEGMKRDK